MVRSRIGAETLSLVMTRVISAEMAATDRRMDGSDTVTGYATPLMSYVGCPGGSLHWNVFSLRNKAATSGVSEAAAGKLGTAPKTC